VEETAYAALAEVKPLQSTMSLGSH